MAKRIVDYTKWWRSPGEEYFLYKVGCNKVQKSRRRRRRLQLPKVGCNKVVE